MTTKQVETKTVRKDWPVIIYVGIFGTGFLTYLVTRIVLDGYPHPIHWASGFVGAVAGFFIGWLWYRWRGDII